jgi:hypothetical protein
MSICALMSFAAKASTTSRIAWGVSVPYNEDLRLRPGPLEGRGGIVFAVGSGKAGMSTRGLAALTGGLTRDVAKKLRRRRRGGFRGSDPARKDRFQLSLVHCRKLGKAHGFRSANQRRLIAYPASLK